MGVAPYKQVLTHGFALDEKARSRSLLLQLYHHTFGRLHAWSRQMCHPLSPPAG